MSTCIRKGKRGASTYKRHRYSKDGKCRHCGNPQPKKAKETACQEVSTK